MDVAAGQLEELFRLEQPILRQRTLCCAKAGKFPLLSGKLRACTERSKQCSSTVELASSKVRQPEMVAEPGTVGLTLQLCVEECNVPLNFSGWTVW